MSYPFRMGQILKGKAGSYTITKQIQKTVWFAKDLRIQKNVVIKSVEGHPRVENERDVLEQLQRRTPFLRPLVDETEEPFTPTTIALRYLDSDVLAETIKRTLNRKELKYVCRGVLEALKVIHEQNLVHTDIKSDNIFVNLQDISLQAENNRFIDVQLGDLGGCYPADSKWATSGTLTGTPIWSSPEVIFEQPWNTAADIWSFGTLLISLVYGGDFNLFLPKVDRYDEEYLPRILMQEYRYFGPYPSKIAEVVSEETVQSIVYIMQEIPLEKMTPFCWTTEKEVTKRDKDFIGKIMMLDWGDWPTAKELLDDEWWDID